MNYTRRLLFFLFFSSNISTSGLLAQSKSIQLQALDDSIEIIVDAWGIPHIYASNEADLFFGQGFNAARDRLFQLEIWRRQATGTVAEMLGPRELKRDIGTRLFQFRGDMEQEMSHYHPHGKKIIEAYVRGVNAYIELTEQQPELLPIEFKLLKIKPQKWTPAVVISRHQGLLGNITQELATSRLVALLGAEKAKEIDWFHPNDPNLELDPKINPDLLFEDVLELYNAYRKPIVFRPEDLISDARTDDLEDYRNLAQADEAAFQELQTTELENIGSNNWVVNGAHTQSNYPMMANDPHRRLAVPSLRYMAHLVAPGWNVIGGGEPEIPGISIGHNEYGAWGLTVFRTDAEDLYVYKTNPDNPNQYWYRGAWENMRIIRDTIPVKGQKPVVVDLKYTRHGPVTFEDAKHQVAFAVRCGWLEVGGSPYLASLRMDQAKNFAEFRAACHYSNIPGENMIWADRAGNIGWQAVGIAPIRRNWSGLVPVPGDGSHEWDGYLPIEAKPHVFNPKSGMFNTSNAKVTPNDYPYKDAIGFSWSDPYRQDRVAEMLASGRRHSLEDMARYQTDYLSIPARQLVPLLNALPGKDSTIEKARQYLLHWNFRMEARSIAAGIYNAWEKQLRDDMLQLVVPPKARPFAYLQLKKVIDWLVLPDGKFGANPISGRNELLQKSLQEAVLMLTKKLGEDMQHWQLGQLDYKHVLFKHPLSNAAKAALRAKLEVGPEPRAGYSFSVNNTSSNDNQSSGATFRIIVDTGDWDACLGTNPPGQSGDPENPLYRNLFETWVKDAYFPVFYSKKKIESVEEEKILLEPGG